MNRRTMLKSLGAGAMVSGVSAFALPTPSVLAGEIEKYIRLAEHTLPLAYQLPSGALPATHYYRFNDKLSEIPEPLIGELVGELKQDRGEKLLEATMLELWGRHRHTLKGMSCVENITLLNSAGKKIETRVCTPRCVFDLSDLDCRRLAITMSSILDLGRELVTRRDQVVATAKEMGGAGSCKMQYTEPKVHIKREAFMLEFFSYLSTASYAQTGYNK
jgi:hypothetical protein